LNWNTDIHDLQHKQAGISDRASIECIA